MPYICKSKKSKKATKDAYSIVIFGKEKVLKWKTLIGSSNQYRIKGINATVAQWQGSCLVYFGEAFARIFS